MSDYVKQNFTLVTIFNVNWTWVRDSNQSYKNQCISDIVHAPHPTNKYRNLLRSICLWLWNNHLKIATIAIFLLSSLVGGWSECLVQNHYSTQWFFDYVNKPGHDTPLSSLRLEHCRWMRGWKCWALSGFCACCFWSENSAVINFCQYRL